jgi:RimJ/RimL family protein N-acetyltransferase
VLRPVYPLETGRLVLRPFEPGDLEGLGLRRVIGRCDALNLPSARLMERLGMRREAHFVHNEIFKGAWGDELVHAMLEDDWRGRVSGGRPG